MNYLYHLTAFVWKWFVEVSLTPQNGVVFTTVLAEMEALTALLEGEEETEEGTALLE